MNMLDRARLGVHGSTRLGWLWDIKERGSDDGWLHDGACAVAWIVIHGSNGLTKREIFSWNNTCSTCPSCGELIVMSGGYGR